MPKISFSVKPRPKNSTETGRKIDCGTAKTRLKIGESDRPMLRFSPMTNPSAIAIGAPIRKEAITRTMVSDALARKEPFCSRDHRVATTSEGGGRSFGSIAPTWSPNSHAPIITATKANCVKRTRDFMTKFWDISTECRCRIWRARSISGCYVSDNGDGELISPKWKHMRYAEGRTPRVTCFTVAALGGRPLQRFYQWLWR